MSGARVYITDDERYITHILGGVLRSAGYEVETLNDPEAAYELVTASPPGVLVTDYQMPKLDGLELSRRLHADARTAGVPVILLTAVGRRLKAEDLAGTNIREVLEKPFSATELLGKIRQVLGESAPGEEHHEHRRSA